MKPQVQRYGHDDPEHWGDCYRTAVASLLDLDRDSVPHFYDFPDYAKRRHDLKVPPQEELRAADDRRTEWLRRRGYEIVTVALNAVSPEQAMEGFSKHNPGITFILCGRSKNDTSHSVLVQDGEIVWEPSPVKSGIIGPEVSTESYWAEFFVKGQVVR